MVGTTDSPWGRESVSGCCLRAGPLPHWWLDGARHRGEGRPAGIGAGPMTTSGAPQYRGPSVPAAADPRHDVAPEPSRPEAWTKSTSLGTEWRCGDPSAGTVGQATRSQREGARVEGEVRAWCWTRHTRTAPPAAPRNDGANAPDITQAAPPTIVGYEYDDSHLVHRSGRHASPPHRGRAGYRAGAVDRTYPARAQHRPAGYRLDRRGPVDHSLQLGALLPHAPHDRRRLRGAPWEGHRGDDDAAEPDGNAATVRDSRRRDAAGRRLSPGNP